MQNSEGQGDNGRDKQGNRQREDDPRGKGIDGHALVGGADYHGQHRIHGGGAGKGHGFDISKSLSYHGSKDNSEQLMQDVGEKGGGRYGEGVGGQQGGSQGVPPKAGRGGHTVLGAKGEQQPCQGGHRKGADHDRQRDQNHPQTSLPHAGQHALLTSKVQSYQEQQQVQTELDDLTAVDGQGIGQDKVAQDHAKRHSEDNEQGEVWSTLTFSPCFSWV